MTNEAVNEMEEKLRQAQKLVEEAGQLVCVDQHNALTFDTWGALTTMANDIGEIIHTLWKLRPED